MRACFLLSAVTSKNAERVIDFSVFRVILVPLLLTFDSQGNDMKSRVLHILLLFAFYLPFVQAQTGKQTYRFYKDFKVAYPECGPELTQVQAPGSCGAASSPGKFVEDVLPCGVKRFVYHNNMDWGVMYPNSEGLVTETYTIQMYMKVTDWGKSWTRIIDFSNGGLDDGIYFKNRGGSAERCLDFYPNGIVGACPFFNTSTYYLLTITRDGQTGKMDVYVDNTLFATYNDTGKNYVGKAGVPIYIFRDDQQVSCESGQANMAYLAFHGQYFTKTDVDFAFSQICFEANINPYADFSISPNPSCGFPKNIDVKYTGPIQAPGTGYEFTWNWDGGRVISGSGMGPYVLSWDTGGIKYVTLTVTSKACGNPLVNTKQATMSNLNLTTAVTPGNCDVGTDGTVTLTGADGLAPYQYSVDSVNYQFDNIFRLPAASYRVFVKDGNNCTVAKNVDVQFISDVNVRAMPDTIICEGESVQLTTESNGQTFAWLPQDGLDNSSASEPVATPLTTTQYVVKATKGYCTQTDTVNVRVSPKIQVNVTPDALIEYNVPFQLTASSPQIKDYRQTVFVWSPATGLNDPASQSPVAILQDNQSYTVEITSELGCKGSGQVNLSIKRQESIIIPTAFTPNGDGRNEVLTPITNEIESIRYFRIFNRWGQVVFYTDQLNTGWDGYFKGNAPLAGTYVWEVEGVSNKGRVITKKGAVMLLR